MAKTEFTYACGHEAWTDLRGSQKSRDFQLKRLESEQCPACWGAARIAASKAEGAEAVAKVKASGAAWPALRGTEKQVAWAEQIRARAIVWLEAGDEHVLGSARASMVRALATIEPAGWFCDRARQAPEMVFEAALCDLARRDLRTWTRLVAADVAGELAAELEERAGTDAQDDDRALRAVRRRAHHVVMRICHAASSGRGWRDPPTPREELLLDALWPALVAELRDALRGRGLEVDTGGWEEQAQEEERP